MFGRSKSKSKPRPTREPQPLVDPAFGLAGRGGGRMRLVQAPTEYRASTMQACGLWPFAVGAGAPIEGAPLGHHLSTGAAVCADPISWFRAGIIRNPSAVVLSNPGVGKSTTVAHQLIGLSAFGTIPLVLGDTRPDYVETVRALGGQVISIGPGRGSLNVLDPGEALEAAKRLQDAGKHSEYEAVMGDALSRITTMVNALITIHRAGPVNEEETIVLDRAIRLLLERASYVPPVLGDLLALVKEAPEPLRAAVLALDEADYRMRTRGLVLSLSGLTGGGTLGSMFSRRTSEPMRRDRPAVYDLSAIAETDTDVRAAALMACWSAGFGTVSVAQALADAGLERRRHYVVVLDELWQALRVGHGMAQRIDVLTRLNRREGIGQIMIFHTMKDLDSLANEEDRAIARGFVERAGMVMCGALPRSEMARLTSVVDFSQTEQDLLVSWNDAPPWTIDQFGGEAPPPPGRGRFLIKVGGRPGIPIEVKLTSHELRLANSNRRWTEASRIGAR